MSFDDPKPFGRLLSWGNEFAVPDTHGWWLLLGPLAFEAHRSFRVGATAGWAYVGVYLGPFTVTFGYRRLVPRTWRFVVDWTPIPAPGTFSNVVAAPPRGIESEGSE